MHSDHQHILPETQQKPSWYHHDGLCHPLWLSPKHEIYNPEVNTYPNHRSLYFDIGVIDGNESKHLWTFFDYSGHSSGELEVHTHTTTMHPGKTTCIRLLRRRRGPSGLHAFVFLRREENLPSTTGWLCCHDHDRPGALRPMPASSTQPIGVQTTCSISSRPLMEFLNSKTKPISNYNPHPPETIM